MDLYWNDLGSAYGYAVESCSSLTDGDWQLADPVDYWPVPGTNWSTPTTNAAFFRGRAAHRGRLVASEHLQTLSPPLIDLLLYTFFGGSPPISAVYTVSVYSVTYETFDHRGASVLASGAVAFPAGSGIPSAPVVSYQHGTMFLRTDAPSTPLASDQGYGVAMGTHGYVVCMPDYLGLGTNSPPLHPYLHSRSEAVACVDMLRACRVFVTNSTSLALNGKLFIIGYSQGGHATLALQRELEQHHTNEFPITASAPMAGPHDLSGTTTDRLLSDVAYTNPEYLAYLLFGYNSVYPLFDSPSEVLKSPYYTTLPPVMDGAHAANEVRAEMPAVPKQIFKDEYLAAFQSDSNHPLRAALRTNDTFRWVPQAKTRLYHCAGDTVVPQANSLVAYSNFVAHGSTNATFEDPSPASDHGDGALPCFLAAKAWFDSM